MNEPSSEPGTERRPWFDPQTGMLLLDEYVAEMPSFQTIMEDRVVTEDEFTGQVARTVNALRELEASLDDRQHRLATQALSELGVLYALERSVPGLEGEEPISPEKP